MSGRHRIRYLKESGRYVCSRRGCGYGSNNLTEALMHCASENQQVDRVA
jgi:hypothetical protein